MDTTVLVDEQIDRIEAGRELLRRLGASGFDVAAAGWVKESESGRWYLYIVSPVVDECGPLAAYRRVDEGLSAGRDGGISLTDIKLVGNEESIAKDLIKYRSSHSWAYPLQCWPGVLGPTAVEELFLYPSPLPESLPASAGRRMVFEVDYRRRDGTNRWQSTARLLFMHDNLATRGAIGPRREDDGHETAVVFEEVDPDLDRSRYDQSPRVRERILNQARARADRVFMVNHPDAVIEHVGDAA
ncbi:MAG TPA: hypothetical protein VG406_12205 [Isosphaeraceae bacterium]|jgi:hypothetical protein|nr:hypothetical protein [Isosphaeraceae bacterium]